MSRDSIHESRLRAGRKNFERPLVNPDVCVCVYVFVWRAGKSYFEETMLPLTIPKSSKRSLKGSLIKLWENMLQPHVFLPFPSILHSCKSSDLKFQLSKRC